MTEISSTRKRQASSFSNSQRGSDAKDNNIQAEENSKRGRSVTVHACDAISVEIAVNNEAFYQTELEHTTFSKFVLARSPLLPDHHTLSLSARYRSRSFSSAAPHSRTLASQIAHKLDDTETTCLKAYYIVLNLTNNLAPVDIDKAVSNFVIRIRVATLHPTDCRHPHRPLHPTFFPLADPSNKSLIFKTDRFTSAILDNASFIHDPAQLDEVILKYVEFLKNLSARFLYGSQDDTLTGDEFYDKNLAAVAEDQEGVLAEDDLVT
ncbi:hypothetical protein BLNAU_12358 [Blattamonas nauphoetae]|uniref:Uncharacterized protein n=1 Tax=Blattamonas nauphoetae TaxID=2049346 RepID=A0ABQ9XMG3_9EUKA|nr:hypothetical protein BLNAU_12358 [Blattamonas nauphoetae]